jgi:DEAD/DEAH box helicase domain-containing protein
MRIHLNKVLEELAKERKSYKEKAEDIRKQIKAIKSLPQDESTRTDIARLERERQKKMELAKEINDRDLLNTLTDAGLIPNYAFPETGVELKSLLWRKKSSDDPTDSPKYISLPVERYERPAKSALSEFAPENLFYANQRKIEIDQINMELSTQEKWRLCPTCQHMENLEIHADTHNDPEAIDLRVFCFLWRPPLAGSHHPENARQNSLEPATTFLSSLALL